MKEVSDTMFVSKKGARKNSSKYINPLTDFGFKYIFSEKASLLNFLNAVLDIEGGIADLTYQNPERMPHSEEERKAQFDLHCTTGTGERVIIEMQNHYQKFFKDRTVYYAAFPIQEQAPRGEEWDYELKPVFSVNIVNFPVSVKNGRKKKTPKKTISFIQLMDRDTKEVFYKKLTFVYLELSQFDKVEKDLQTGVDEWMYLLKNLSGLTEIPEKLKNEVFGQLFRMAEIAKLTKAQRRAYNQSLKNYRDMNNIIAYRDELVAFHKKEAVMWKNQATAFKKEKESFKKENVFFKKENESFKKEKEKLEKEIAELRRSLELGNNQLN